MKKKAWHYILSFCNLFHFFSFQRRKYCLVRETEKKTELSFHHVCFSHELNVIVYIFKWRYHICKMLFVGFRALFSLFYLSQHIQNVVHRTVALKVIVCWGLIDCSLCWSLREWKRDNPSNCVCCVIPKPIYLLVLGF